jgi:hypothetical protein
MFAPIMLPTKIKDSLRNHGDGAHRMREDERYGMFGHLTKRPKLPILPI